MATKTTLITYDDYQHLPDDRYRYEIIEGELLMTAAPNTEHQRISRKLLISLNNYVEEKELGEVFDAPIDVVLSMTDVVQPDLVFISAEHQQIVTKKNIVAAPDLIVEIVSEHTKTVDRTRKKTLYEKYGVREYWIVYPDEKEIEQFILQGDTFKLNDRYEEPEKLTSHVLEGFVLHLKYVFSK